MEKFIDKNKINFFWKCFLAMLFVCIVIFLWLTSYLSGRTQEMIMQVSNIYMHEMNMQFQEKFGLILDMRESQLHMIIGSALPTEEYSEDTILQLEQTAEAAENITWMALYGGGSELEIIYGGEMTCNTMDSFDASLEDNGRLVARGFDAEGEVFLILGTAAEYHMRSGAVSKALLVGMPMDQLRDMMVLQQESDASSYSNIINLDGEYIVRRGGVSDKTYFENLIENVDEVDGVDGEYYVKQLQQAMAEEEDYFMLVTINGQRRHIYCSSLAENTYWYLISVLPDEILGRSISELDRLRIMTMSVAVLVIIVAMLMGFLMYYRLSQRQIKELDNAKMEAIRANNAKSEFLASMSHDIRTPMNAIIGMTEIAQRNMQDPERVEDCLQKINLSSKHLLGLINDVLDMSKIESGNMTLNFAPMSLREFMDDIVNIMQPQVRDRSQYFDIFIQDILAENVYCDSVRINQVILNLLSNAVKFTPTEGRIDVYVYQEPSALGEEYICTHFRVKDTGIGMSKEFQKRIFDTFAREETEQVAHITGTGLGMSITKSIVDLMGGTIELESQQGLGSEFHITLDMKKASTGDMEMRLPEWDILVVDDNEQLCQSAVSNLKELGINAEWALSGERAVEMVEDRHRNGRDYNFVLIDWKMPGMNGLKTIEEIRRRVSANIPLFLISAYDWNDIVSDAQDTEIDGFIAKPLFKSTLYEHLRHYMDGYKEEDIHKSDQSVNFNGRRILLAEDIDINWEIANEIFSAMGLVLDRAENGKECLEKFQSSELGYYDLILMDIRMPVMNGYEASEAIRALDRADNDLPIIAMTADAFSDDTQRCIDSGMNAHIAKPIDVELCTRVLQQYLK